MNLTIAMITGRAEPHIEWVLQAIAQQRTASDFIDFIVVDALGRSCRTLAGGQPWTNAVQDLRVVPTKPNIWQGKHRVTSHEWWAKSAGANTALCLAKHDYIAFLDDRAVPGPRWLETVRQGNRKRKSVIAGAYEKIEDGDRKLVDHRIQLHPNGKPDCGGEWLYGCTFALPTNWALDVNGFEEGVDGLGAEDVVFGFNLANAGHKIDFVPSLFVQFHRPSRSLVPLYRRVDPGISPLDKSHAALARFGQRRRTEFTPDLMAIRAELARGGSFPIPDPKVDYRDWYDGSLIREFEAPPRPPSTIVSLLPSVPALVSAPTVAAVAASPASPVSPASAIASAPTKTN